MKRKRSESDEDSDSNSSSSAESPSPPPIATKPKSSKEHRSRQRFKERHVDNDPAPPPPKKKPEKKKPNAMVTEQMSDKHKRSGAGIVNLLARVDPDELDGFDADSTQVPDKRWSFEIFQGGKKKKNEVVNRVEVVPKPWLVVGRAYDNDIIIMEKKEKLSISRRHCIVGFMDDGRPALFDLNSTHGTYVNDMSGKLKNDGRIPSGQWVPINPGNRILFGRCGYQYSLVYEGWEAEEEKRKKEEFRQRAENARRGGRGRGRGGTFRTLAQVNREASKMKRMAEDQKANFGKMMSADLTAVPE